MTLAGRVTAAGGIGMWARLPWAGIVAVAAGMSYATPAELVDILNGPVLDQRTPSVAADRHASVAPGVPVGQTIVTGPGSRELTRVAIWQAFWHESWQPDESLVLTLWDSPERKVSLGRFAIPYARRMHEGAISLFDLDATVEPERAYYLELTVEVEPLRPAELPREWVLSGKRDPAAGGDGVVGGIGTASGDYAAGTAYVGGEAQDYDLWFETHVRRERSADDLLGEAFGRFDLSRPDLAELARAVVSKDWDAAASALVEHFERRTDLFPTPEPAPAGESPFDTREADLAAEQKVLLADGTTVDLGPHWNHYALWPERGGVGLTRSGLRKPLAAGYQRTHNEKYARAFVDMIRTQIARYPSPIRAGAYAPEETIPAALPCGIAGGSFWSGLAIGARMGHGFHYYAPFVDSPYFTRDVRAAFIINLGEMAEVLEHMQGGGNWETQMSVGLFEVGLAYPEFVRAREWVKQGFETVVENALSTVRPDGCLQEPAIGYHMMCMRRYARIIREAADLGLTVPDEMRTLTERMYEYVMYCTLPDGTLPIWGDANPPMRPDDLVPDADLFGREDFRYVGSAGQQGTPPDETSRGFADGGFYFQRSGWDSNAHYMGIRCGPFGSHGHFDALSMVVASYGKLRLIDPGIHVYGTPEAKELMSTASHNTVSVDGADARSAVLDRWEARERLDYFAGHNEGYGGVEGVTHHRRVLFVKPHGGRPGLWLVFDDIVGNGTHRADLHFRFAPSPMGADPNGSGVWTSDADANLLVRTVGAPLTLGEGIAVVAPDGLRAVPVATARREGTLPFTFTSLLLPFRGAETPDVVLRELPVEPPGAGARGTWVQWATGEALLVFVAPLESDDPDARYVVRGPDGFDAAMTAACAAIWLRREGDRWQAEETLGVGMRSDSPEAG